jgi:hypothetical protein
MKDDDVITIICDNPDCEGRLRLALDTLRAAKSVKVTCPVCGGTQRVTLDSESGEIEIFHLSH